jgi:hypothetical protein
MSASGGVRSPVPRAQYSAVVQSSVGRAERADVFTSTSALGQQAYALEFYQANNRFGIINLLTGGFTQLGTEGGIIFNDIAAALSGALYGIINTTSLVS